MSRPDSPAHPYVHTSHLACVQIVLADIAFGFVIFLNQATPRNQYAMTKKNILFATLIVTLLSMVGIAVFSFWSKGFGNEVLISIIGVIGTLVGIFHRHDFFEDKRKKSRIEQKDSDAAEAETSNVTAQHLAKGEPPPPTPQNQLRPGPVSVEAYFEQLEKLTGRFAELNHYIKSVNGTRINWKCVVDTANEQGPDKALVILRSPNAASLHCFLTLPKACLGRALALHPGDLVSFQGVLDTSRVPNAPDLEAEDFTIEEIKESKKQ